MPNPPELGMGQPSILRLVEEPGTNARPNGFQIFPHCGLAVVILAGRRGHRRLVAAASARIGFWVASDSERFSVAERRMKAMSARPF